MRPPSPGATERLALNCAEIECRAGAIAKIPSLDRLEERAAVGRGRRRARRRQDAAERVNLSVNLATGRPLGAVDDQAIAEVQEEFTVGQAPRARPADRLEFVEMPAIRRRVE